jgi:hypothetical protein
MPTTPELMSKMNHRSKQIGRDCCVIAPPPHLENAATLFVDSALAGRDMAIRFCYERQHCLPRQPPAKTRIPSWVPRDDDNQQ